MIYKSVFFFCAHSMYPCTCLCVYGALYIYYLQCKMKKNTPIPTAKILSVTASVQSSADNGDDCIAINVSFEWKHFHSGLMCLFIGLEDKKGDAIQFEEGDQEYRCKGKYIGFREGRSRKNSPVNHQSDSSICFPKNAIPDYMSSRKLHYCTVAIMLLDGDIHSLPTLAKTVSIPFRISYKKQKSK